MRIGRELPLKFYKKIGDVLITRVLDVEEIDSEFKEIVERVLQRLNEVKDIDANASFDCLRETMQIYLQQIPSEGRGANWIVRNFEQIDGEVSDYAIEKANNIANFIAQEHRHILGVEEVQDLVENGLMYTRRKDVARAYIRYRQERERVRKWKTERAPEMGLFPSFCKG